MGSSGETGYGTIDDVITLSYSVLLGNTTTPTVQFQVGAGNTEMLIQPLVLMMLMP